MLRVSLIFLLLSHRIGTAFITDPPSFADRLGRLYEKIEKFTAPHGQEISTEDKLYAKLDRLNSLTPTELSVEDEEMLSAMQMWGKLSPDQLEKFASELQKLKSDEGRSEKLVDGDYAEGEWIDEELQDLGEGDYPMDAIEEWEEIETDSSTAKPTGAVTPSAFTKLEPGQLYRDVVSGVDPIAATKERPKILDDSSLSVVDRESIRRGALRHITSVVKAGKCLTPQPRWLSVRQMAPAADTVYMPPCIQLHRCLPDSGCCHSEEEVCAPVDGKYVTLPFYLRKANGSMLVSRMVFFNHTRCGCVNRETLQTSVKVKVENQQSSLVQRDSIKDAEWRSTEEPRLEKDEEPTAPPQLRRCTCPTLFLARITDSGMCSCVCDWPEQNRRRDCLLLAKGREHFGLRDRVCVDHGDCNPPACEYGAYEKSNGKCPMRRYRRMRYHRGRSLERL